MPHSACSNALLLILAFTLTGLTLVINIYNVVIFGRVYQLMESTSLQYGKTRFARWTSSAALYQQGIRFMAVLLNVVVQVCLLLSMVLECFIVEPTPPSLHPFSSRTWVALMVIGRIALILVTIMATLILLATLHRHERLLQAAHSESLSKFTWSSLLKRGIKVFAVIHIMLNVIFSGIQLGITDSSVMTLVNSLLGVIFLLCFTCLALLELILNIRMIWITLKLTSKSGDKKMRKKRHCSTSTHLVGSFVLLTLMDVMALLGYIILLEISSNPYISVNICYPWFTFHMLIAFKLLDIYKNAAATPSTETTTSHVTELSTVPECVHTMEDQLAIMPMKPTRDFVDSECL